MLNIDFYCISRYNESIEYCLVERHHSLYPKYRDRNIR